MYTSAIKKGMRYLAASIVIAAAGAVYGLFGHGVYSYYMTYAFMIPLLAGAVPHLLAAMKGEGAQENAATEAAAGPALSQADALADASAKVQVDEYSEAAVMQDAERQEEAPENTDEPARKQWLDIGSAQLAFIVTLTAGSLLKGVLDIYGTTNRLLIAYPASALLILAFMAAAALKQSGKLPRIKCRETVNETITEAAE